MRRKREREGGGGWGRERRSQENKNCFRCLLKLTFLLDERLFGIVSKLKLFNYLKAFIVVGNPSAVVVIVVIVVVLVAVVAAVVKNRRGKKKVFGADLIVPRPEVTCIFPPFSI